MKKALCATLCIFAACGTSARLEEGRWTGALMPMTHPDVANPVVYDVGYEGSVLHIDLVAPGGAAVPTREVSLETDTLRFTFNEPEEGVRLRCALARDGAGGFAGRCADIEGKWAGFTMRPPE